MDAVLGFACFWSLFVAFSTAIGFRINRAIEGFALGALLGPAGMLITGIALRPRYRRHCPDCLGGIPEQAKKCRHCGSEV